MTTSTTGAHTLVYPVTDLEAATRAFSALLGEPHTSTPYYVGFSAGDQEIGLDPNGAAQGLAGPTPYFHVADIAAVLGRMGESGARTVREPRDVGGGRLIAVAEDPDGNPVGLLQDQ
jgi:predicted enzyme related to lactoylglutathione lyase